MRDNAPGVVPFARKLRKALSPPELKLWLELKASAKGRNPFRKQHPIGPHVLDFYAPSVRLAVEIDGWSHNMGGQGERDERRDAWLGLSHIEVMRIPAAEVMRDAGDVADGLLRIVDERRGTPSDRLRRPPPPKSGRSRSSPPYRPPALGRGPPRDPRSALDRSRRA